MVALVRSDSYGNLKLSDLSKLTSKVLQAEGAPILIQIRTRYLEDAVLLRQKGHSKDQVDKILLEKFIKENPEEARILLDSKYSGTSRDEVIDRLKDTGVDMNIVDEEEIEVLRQLSDNLKRSSQTLKLLDLENIPKPPKPRLEYRTKVILVLIVN